MTRVSNCGGKLIRKWEGVGVKYGISHHWFQPDCQSPESELTSVTGLPVTLSQTEHQSSCKFESKTAAPSDSSELEANCTSWRIF